MIFLALPLAAFSQGLVKVNILDLYGQVPAPPKSVHEAYTRAHCEVNGDISRCDTKAFYKDINTKVNEIGGRIEKANAALSQPTAAMMSIDPQEIQKKMATMSEAEKMQFAMAMTKQMGLGSKALAPEPAAVQDAMEEYHTLNQLLAEEMQQAAAIAEKKGRLHSERSRKHREADEWVSAEIGKLPMISFGEYGRDHDPKAVYTIKVKGMERHIAIENDYLRALQKQFSDLLAEQKSRYTPLQQKLAAISYGDDATNIETKRSLLGAQQLMMGPVQELLSFSENATDEAVNWWMQKLNLEKQKPM
jgi:hypothetical protein